METLARMLVINFSAAHTHNFLGNFLQFSSVKTV